MLAPGARISTARSVRVTVVAREADLGVRWWSSGPGRFWPGRVPHVRGLSFSDVCHHAGATEALGESDALVMLGDPADPVNGAENAAAAAAWRCQESGCRGLVLAEASSGAVWRRLSEGGGLMLLSPDTDPRVVAGLAAGIAQSARGLKELEQQAAVSAHAQAHADRWIRVLDDELHLAARLQQEIMPRSLPGVRGVEMGALFRPLWHVSGDIYRVTRLDERHVGLMLADAMGHGVAAAMYTMLIACGLIGTEAHGSRRRIVPPGEALARLNLDLIRQQHDRDTHAVRFASAVYLVIDLETREARGCSAGHAGPLRVGPTSWREQDGSGPVLGVFEDAEFEEFTFTMEPGETLVVYSDGVEQALLDEAIAVHGGRPTGSGLPAHREMLAEALVAREGQSLSEAMEALGEALNMRAGSLHRTDDLTVVGLRLLDP